MSTIVGQAIDRKDGPAKVTGTAKYAAEFKVPGLLYGVTVQSTITKGHINTINVATVKKMKGVVDVMTYKNAMSLHQPAGSDPGSGKFSEKDLLPLQSERIFYNGQHIAVVIAETFEIAEHAASQLTVSYDEEEPVHDIQQAGAKTYQPQQGLGGTSPQFKRGESGDAFAKAVTNFEGTYTTPVYHHNPMEPHATTAVWEDEELTVYDSTQGVFGVQNLLSTCLGVAKDKVRVISPFIGGGFGSKGFMWANTLLAPMAAKLVNKPVKIVLDRSFQMFTCAGRRTTTIQKINLGTEKDGRIMAGKHETTSETSFVDEFVEQAGVATKMLYAIPNLDIVQNLVRLNKGTPCPTRAPGEAPGTFAFEVAMDELAEKLKIDPVQFRILNYAEKSPADGKEFSEKNLKECYEKGAVSIGWNKRSETPGTVKEGRWLTGYGMATATYPANRSKATVKLKIYQDGHAVAACCTQDIGTGTYTVMAQIMADALGLPVDKVEFKLGDSLFPQGPNSGGSQTMATTGPAVRAAALKAKSNVVKLAIGDKKSPLYQQSESGIIAEGGRLFLQQDNSKGETYTQILTRNKMELIDADATTDVTLKDGQKTPPAAPNNMKKPENEFAKEDEKMDREKYAFHSFGAHFVKLKVDSLTGVVKVGKVVSVMDIGKILNEKTAKSQIMGGAVWGIGMALMEGSEYDPRTGRIVTKDLADYHVPVHADMPEFDIQFTGKPDYNLSLVGARGAGEIGITGITAAISNAVYNATGKRVRGLPITPDKLM